jgi:hypothetical protein
MPEAKRLIDEARSQVARVRRRLLNPSAGTLEEGVPELQRAIFLLRQGEGYFLPWTEEQSQAWESAQQLHRELAQVKALARQANEFYSMRIRLLAQTDRSLSYTPNGADGACFAEPVIEGHSEESSVLHG